MIKRILKNILTTPPPKINSHYKKMINEFRSDVLTTIDIKMSNNPTQSEKEWVKNRIELVNKIINYNPLGFLQWDVIKRTMVAAFPQKFIKKELKNLKKHPDWRLKWRMAIKETRVGAPQKYPYYFNSSGNLIHQAFHISEFEKFIKKQINEYDLIFEYGGGYGAMCKLIHSLGYKGKYVIYDLPEFSALQKFYLTANRLKTAMGKDDYHLNSVIININKIDDDNIKLLENNGNKKSLFLATWSLSESPLESRNLVTQYLSKFSGVMIAYQEYFGEVNNSRYFETFKNNFSKIDNWKKYEISHIPTNYYLFGADS